MTAIKRFRQPVVIEPTVIATHYRTTGTVAMLYDSAGKFIYRANRLDLERCAAQIAGGYAQPTDKSRALEAMARAIFPAFDARVAAAIGGEIVAYPTH